MVARRARLYAQVKGLGSMFLVCLPFRDVTAELGARMDVVPAIDSSPFSCVVSGWTARLKRFVKSLKERGVKCFKVKTDVPFHSSLLETLSRPLKEALSGVLRPQKPSIKPFSSSEPDSRSQALRDADYWVNNMTSPVWLTSAINAAAQDGYRVFLEVSSHPVVSHSVNETLLERDIGDFAIVPTMRKNQSVKKCILLALARLHVNGAIVDFSTLFGRKWCSEVPGFRWSQKPFWKEVATGSNGAKCVHDANKHTLLGQRTNIASTDITVYVTRLNDDNLPFPRPYELHGTTIIPAAVYVNTFLRGTGATVISDLILRVPLPITKDPRDVQVILDGQNVKVASRLSSSDDRSWVCHSTAGWSTASNATDTLLVEIEAIKKRIGKLLPNNFSVDYLAEVGVAGIAFPWAVTEHYGNLREMIAKVDTDPGKDVVSWDSSSWAPTLDSACSVGATIFADDAKLRIISSIGKVKIFSRQPPPKIIYLYVKKGESATHDSTSRSADISVLDVHGEILVDLQGLTLAEVDRGSKVSQGLEHLVHQMAWVPARLAENPLVFSHVIIVSDDYGIMKQYEKDLKGLSQIPRVTKAHSVQELDELAGSAEFVENNSAVVYCPGPVPSIESVANLAQKFIWEVTLLVRFIVKNRLPAKFFIILTSTSTAQSATILAQGSLYGLAGIIASEHSDIWGGLIDNDDPRFPILPFRYVQEQDIVRFVDGVPIVARLRPFTKDQLLPSSSTKTLMPRPEGTYVISGGLSSLGLETCDFLIIKGARRLVVLSRRVLPPRSQWEITDTSLTPILRRIQEMDKLGASVHILFMDIGAHDAYEHLMSSPERLSLPPVRGVIHASGVLEDSLLLETTVVSFARVLSPKISGALVLHQAFPPASKNLDFFILFSSIGQLVGTSGQSSYGSGNAFLDTLATHRRSQGDDSVAFQWTAWRGLGMGSCAFLALELQSKGITDITCSEGVRAWEHISKYNVDHAVVARSRTFDEDELIPCSLFEEIAVRRPKARRLSIAAATNASGDGDERPTSIPELRIWLDVKIRECLSSILKISDIEDVDCRAALADFGVDSVMTIVLRQDLQSVLKVKVPHTLTWNYPTVVAMVDWFLKQL